MKKYMTVFLVLMVALMLGSSAFAQEYYTLPEIREQAAQGWHETYKDKYERETVVDIEIEVFGEDKAPVLIAGFPECAEFHNWVDPPIANLMIEARQKRGGQTVYITAAEHGTKIELDKKYGEDYGSNLTPQDVYDYFRYILEQAGRSADHFLYEYPDVFMVRCSTHKKTGEILVPVYYEMVLWPQLYGLPIMTHANTAFEKFGWLEHRPTGLITMQSEELYSVGDNSFVEKEMLAEDIPLCSVDQIIKEAEKQIEAGYIQKVHSLRFGYAVYNDPTISVSKPVSAFDVENWYLVPSWVLECQFSSNPKRVCQNGMPPKEIVINAQTGKMIDPFDTSLNGRGNARYQGFIPWDDVK